MAYIPSNSSSLDRSSDKFSRLCPHCFETLSLRQPEFRCWNKSCKGASTDQVLIDTWGDYDIYGPCIPIDSPTNSTTCKYCNKSTQVRICPHCHCELPPSIADEDSTIIAIIGSKESGKSHYISVLIQQLKRVIGPAYGMILEAVGDDTMKRYKERFEEPLYKNHETLNATDSAVSDKEVARPLIYTLRIEKKMATPEKATGFFNWLAGREFIETDKTVTLVFFDTAGEDLNSEDTMAMVNKYIYLADGIILLLDPLQNYSVRNQLSINDVDLPEINTESSEIITRTVNLIRKGLNLSYNTKIDIPLAVAFTKFDAVEELLPSSSQYNYTAAHNAGFDMRDFNALSGEITNYLQKWNSQDIIFQIRANFTNYGYFAVSALGCNPGAAKKIPTVVPRRVEDPFLWLLVQLNFLRRA